MSCYKVAFIIDKLEFRYFEINDLVTSFWLIDECNQRGWEVYITTIDKLSLNNNDPRAFVYKTKREKINGKIDLTREKESELVSLNNFDMVLFRPDPPVDLDYINATYILDYIDSSKTLVVNNSTGIRKANEKLYINNFPDLVPTNISTSDAGLIKEFLNEQGKIVVKPLNKCFGKGVFYLEKGDTNTNTIIDTATNGGTTVVMAQKFLDCHLEDEIKGDKRILLLGGKILDEVVIKVSGKGDFKFNTHNDEYLKKSFLTDEDQEIGRIISPKLLEDGLFLVGLDVINSKIIEINVTSPCFFIREINSMFSIRFEKKIIDYLESLLGCKNKKLSLSC